MNEDILSNKDKKDATLKGYYKAKSVSDVDYTKEIIICSEITMLKVAKKLLELTFDYVVTFNGNNFDLRYISNRLELLTSGKIIFKSPDK
ncbi:hypothetical protein DEM28_26365, partial [Enterobacter mori]